jgi:N-acetylmuramoyl-L-alanine amidase
MRVLIREGDRSRQVADIQARLRALGRDVDDEPGVFGSATTRTVRAFQQDRGLIADGIVGDDTWGELVEASWRLGDRILYLRHPLMRGDDVAILQQRLGSLGYDAGREDGIFGAETHRAVLTFQREYGIPEDGIFGGRSMAALAGLRVDRLGTAALLREELRLEDAPGLTSALIVVDPGHGGDDPGDQGPSGVTESDLCWEMARRLAEKLVGLGARVRFSRTEVDSPATSERAARANDLEADLFISIHLNSHADGRAQGASTYFFGGSRLGEKLAQLIQNELVSLGIGDCRSHPQSYSLLKQTRMPAVLVEPCFITNAGEEKRLLDPDFRAAVAAAIAFGVRRFYERTDVQEPVTQATR